MSMETCILNILCDILGPFVRYDYSKIALLIHPWLMDKGEEPGLGEGGNQHQNTATSGQVLVRHEVPDGSTE